MIILACIFVVFTLASAQELVVGPPVRIDLKAPPMTERMLQRNINTEWITVPLDHFDPLNKETFRMRYMTNDEFFGGNGSPIFIFVGGEWTIDAGWLRTGNMYEMARENRGHQVYTEHRYYGETLPYQNFTTNNLRYLNVDQALADLAYFITEMKQEPRFANSEVVLQGCSYAANMAQWFKQRYPHLVIGVVASSGPVKAKVHFHEYLEVVEEAFLLEGGEECVSHIRHGIQDTVEAMRTDSGRELLESTYRICHNLEYDDQTAMAYFAGLITWRFSLVVQAAQPGSLQSICNFFNAGSFGSSPMGQIAGFISWLSAYPSCFNLQYELLVDLYSANTDDRAWYYQTCTEYGYFQIAPTSSSIFAPLHWLTSDFYTQICKDAFDESFDVPFVEKSADRVNLMFGGLSPNVNNTITVHGHNDPWRVIGIYSSNIKESSPTFNVARASHCFDIYPWRNTDTMRMTQMQQSIRRLVAEWLS